jgi:hypothetical protein
MGERTFGGEKQDFRMRDQLMSLKTLLCCGDGRGIWSCFARRTGALSESQRICRFDRTPQRFKNVTTGRCPSDQIIEKTAHPTPNADPGSFQEAIEQEFGITLDQRLS